MRCRIGSVFLTLRIATGKNGDWLWFDTDGAGRRTFLFDISIVTTENKSTGIQIIFLIITLIIAWRKP